MKKELPESTRKLHRKEARWDLFMFLVGSLVGTAAIVGIVTLGAVAMLVIGGDPIGIHSLVIFGIVVAPLSYLFFKWFDRTFF